MGIYARSTALIPPCCEPAYFEYEFCCAQEELDNCYNVHIMFVCLCYISYKASKGSRKP